MPFHPEDIFKLLSRNEGSNAREAGMDIQVNIYSISLYFYVCVCMSSKVNRM
jgi:hypothetical protein